MINRTTAGWLGGLRNQGPPGWPIRKIDIEDGEINGGMLALRQVAEFLDRTAAGRSRPIAAAPRAFAVRGQAWQPPSQ